MDVREYEYDDGATDWELTLPAPDGAEYVVTSTDFNRRVFVRDPEKELPFVQVHPEFHQNSDWPDPLESYDINPVEGTVTIDD